MLRSKVTASQAVEWLTLIGMPLIHYAHSQTRREVGGGYCHAAKCLVKYATKGLFFKAGMAGAQDWD